MWVRFTASFDWDVPEYGNRVTLAFKSGQVRNVRKQCGEAAIAAGKAVHTSTPSKETAHA